MGKTWKDRKSQSPYGEASLATWSVRMGTPIWAGSQSPYGEASLATWDAGAAVEAVADILSQSPYGEASLATAFKMEDVGFFYSESQSPYGEASLATVKRYALCEVLHLKSHNPLTGKHLFQLGKERELRLYTQHPSQSPYGEASLATQVLRDRWKEDSVVKGRNPLAGKHLLQRKGCGSLLAQGG